MIGYRITCDGGCGAAMNAPMRRGLADLIDRARRAAWHVADDGAALCPNCDGENE